MASDWSSISLVPLWGRGVTGERHRHYYGSIYPIYRLCHVGHAYTVSDIVSVYLGRDSVMRPRVFFVS